MDPFTLALVLFFALVLFSRRFQIALGVLTVVIILAFTLF